jgi:SPP1 gp7 family putative phage head morphogenesis protein
MSKNVKLSDNVIAHILQLNRVESGTKRDIIKLLKSMRNRLVNELYIDDITEFKKQRLGHLFKETDAIIKSVYVEAKNTADEVLDDLVDIESEFSQKAIQNSIPIEISVAAPTAAFLRTVATDTLIEGLPSADWWKKQETDVQKRFQQVVREGLALGDTPTQMARSLRDTLEVSKSNIQSLIQTSISAVSNNVRVEVFERNDDVIKELKWLTTLDNRVCKLCIPMADKRWKNDADHTPIGHSVQFRRPPIHFNDRCIIVPVTKSFDELGINLPEPSAGTRPSVVNGTVIQQPGGTTFRSFLDRQSKEFQNDTLGPGRAKLWRDNKITLSDLTNGRGRELTIVELRKKIESEIS